MLSPGLLRRLYEDDRDLGEIGGGRVGAGAGAKEEDSETVLDFGIWKSNGRENSHVLSGRVVGLVGEVDHGDEGDGGKIE